MNHFCLTIISSLETMLIPFMLEIFFHSHSQALETYGTLTGMALPFLFFPATIINSLSVMLMPAISSAYDQNNTGRWKTQSLPAFIFAFLSAFSAPLPFLFTERCLGRLFSTVKKLDSMSIYFPFYVHLCMPHRQLRVF